MQSWSEAVHIERSGEEKGNSFADCQLWGQASGLPRQQSGKESACIEGDGRDMGSIPGLGGSSGVGNGNLLQCAGLEYSTDRGAWWATVHGVMSRTQLSDSAHTGWE